MHVLPFVGAIRMSIQMALWTCPLVAEEVVPVLRQHNKWDYLALLLAATPHEPWRCSGISCLGLTSNLSCAHPTRLLPFSPRYSQPSIQSSRLPLALTHTLDECLTGHCPPVFHSQHRVMAVFLTFLIWPWCDVNSSTAHYVITLLQKLVLHLLREIMTDSCYGTTVQNQILILGKQNEMQGNFFNDFDRKPWLFWECSHRRQKVISFMIDLHLE